MKDRLNWGIIGTGSIASDFVEALQGSARGRIVSVVGSSPAKSAAFSQEWQVPRAAASIEDLLGDSSVDAVYVATPHSLHEENTLAAIAARKAILCEKPLALDAASATRMIDAARTARVFLMEAFMYRCHPMMNELLARIQAGVIGRLRHVRSDFGIRVPRNPKGRLYNPALGGGGILDVGGYPLSFARLLAGTVIGQPFAEPISWSAQGFVGETGTDEIAMAGLRFASGMTATLTCAVHHVTGTQTEIFGEDGRIVLPNPWIPGGDRYGRTNEFTIFRDGTAPEIVKVAATQSAYAIEADVVADSLPNLEAPWPAMTWSDTLGNMRGLDTWRANVQSSQG